MIPVPWDPSFYVVLGDQAPAGDMLKSEYAKNGGYGVVDKALSAFYVTWEGITDPPLQFPPTPHAPSHLPYGGDEIGLASTLQAGLMSPGDGDATTYYGGDNQLHPISGAGTIWFTGAGAPGVIAGSKPGDLYLDTQSGQVYLLS